MKARPDVPPIVRLATAIDNIQAERAKASARLRAVETEAEKLRQTLAVCDKSQAAAEREIARLAAER